MENSLEKKIDLMLDQQRTIMQDIGSINRAIYGDEKNHVPGLLQRQLQDEKNIEELKMTKKRVVWGLAGAITVFEIIRELFSK